jgi:hypothetical protein
MSNVTPKGNYPYPDPTDAVSDYPATASTFAGYVDNLPNRNVIINPFFDIWQRGTAPATTVSGTYTADRWRLDWDGTGGGRDVYASTPTLGTSIGGMQPYRAANVNVATLATGQSFMRFAQRIEGVRSLAGETATLSLYVSSTVAPKTVTIRAVQNFGTGGSPSSAVTTTIGTATTTTSYARKIYTFTVPALTGKTIGSNGNDYLEIHFDLGTQTGNFSFWGVQLEQNTTATALERRPIQQELALCHRYYYKPGGLGTNTIFGSGFANTTTQGYLYFLHPSLRINAQTIEWSTLQIGLPGYSGPAVTALTISGPNSSTGLTFLVATVASGLTASARYEILQNGSTGFIAVGAEL